MNPSTINLDFDNYTIPLNEFLVEIYHREPLERCELVCTKCKSHDLTFVGMINRIEHWHCNDCGQTEKFTLE